MLQNCPAREIQDVVIVLQQNSGAHRPRAQGIVNAVHQEWAQKKIIKIKNYVLLKCCNEMTKIMNFPSSHLSSLPH